MTLSLIVENVYLLLKTYYQNEYPPALLRQIEEIFMFRLVKLQECLKSPLTKELAYGILDKQIKLIKSFYPVPPKKLLSDCSILFMGSSKPTKLPFYFKTPRTEVDYLNVKLFAFIAVHDIRNKLNQSTVKFIDLVSDDFGNNYSFGDTFEVSKVEKLVCLAKFSFTGDYTEKILFCESNKLILGSLAESKVTNVYYLRQSEVYLESKSPGDLTLSLLDMKHKVTSVYLNLIDLAEAKEAKKMIETKRNEVVKEEVRKCVELFSSFKAN